MRVMLNGVVNGMKMPHFRRAATEAGVSEGEFDGTLGNLVAVESTLKAAPHEKLEAMVARFDPQLTAHVQKFHKDPAQHVLPAFREAQMLAGFIATVMVKSKLHE
ncbi:MAG TPA: hypothetical protein VN224_15505 [Xanthomonadales bacterium]|nr:hypothetical protein [Xanthomonadales bacterium]